MSTRSASIPVRERGFSLVELLVVIVVIAILALWGIPSLLATLSRTRLVGASKEVATMMQVGRLEAIKKGNINGDLQGRVTALRYIAGERAFEVVLDETTDATFNPARVVLGRYILPTGISLQAPGEASPEGANAIDGWDVPPGGPDEFPGPIFVSDGSVRVPGAFRLADTRGNFLEVRVDFPATGKVVIQKYFPADNEWYENGEAGKTWEW